MSNLNAEEYKSFERIKQIDDNGVEFWYARELASILEYVQWRNFEKVISKAKLACRNSGFNIADDFADLSKIVEAGATSKEIKDYKLSRYACYLIVQNGDPRKEIIALRTNLFCNSNKKTRSCRLF